jgi:hypothetical protein
MQDRAGVGVHDRDTPSGGARTIHLSVPRKRKSRDVTIKGVAAVAHFGEAGALVPSDTPTDTLNELRRLFLAEDAMNNVAAAARAFLVDHPPPPSDRRARTVAAAGIAAMFCRPFSADNERKRLDAKEWREFIADDLRHAAMFDRILERRNKVLAHADTNTGIVNVTNTYRMFATRQPDDPIVLRVYDLGADGGLLELDALHTIAELADRLALLMSHRMADLGAKRRPELMPPSPDA